MIVELVKYSDVLIHNRMLVTG